MYDDVHETVVGVVDERPPSLDPLLLLQDDVFTIHVGFCVLLHLVPYLGRVRSCQLVLTLPYRPSGQSQPLPLFPRDRGPRSSFPVGVGLRVLARVVHPLTDGSRSFHLDGLHRDRFGEQANVQDRLLSPGHGEGILRGDVPDPSRPHGVRTGRDVLDEELPVRVGDGAPAELRYHQGHVRQWISGCGIADCSGYRAFRRGDGLLREECRQDRGREHRRP